MDDLKQELELYKSMYFRLYSKMADIHDLLEKAMQETEEIFESHQSTPPPAEPET